jgi:hypothetical protein
MGFTTPTNKSSYGREDPENRAMSVKYYKNKGDLMGLNIRQLEAGKLLLSPTIDLANCFPWLQILYKNRTFTTFDDSPVISEFKQQILAFAISKFNDENYKILERKMNKITKKRIKTTEKDKLKWQSCSPTGNYNSLTFIKDKHYHHKSVCSKSKPSGGSRKPRQSTSKTDDSSSKTTKADNEPAPAQGEETPPPGIVLLRFSKTLGQSESEMEEVAAIMNAYFFDKPSDKKRRLSVKTVLEAVETLPPFDNDSSQLHWWDHRNIRIWQKKHNKDLFPLWCLL